MKDFLGESQKSTSLNRGKMRKNLEIGKLSLPLCNTYSDVCESRFFSTFLGPIQ